RVITPPLLYAFLRGAAVLCAPHSSPTRRSSDLDPANERRAQARPIHSLVMRFHSAPVMTIAPEASGDLRGRCRSTRPPSPSRRRSEEHTSELQSRENLVCRLLLEKKKKITFMFI